MSFVLSADDGTDTLKVEVFSLDDINEDDDEWYQLVKRWQQRQRDLDEDTTPVLGMSIDRGIPDRKIPLPVMDDGTIMHDRYSRFTGNGQSGNPVHFLAIDNFSPASMGEQWDAILEKGLEEEIISDMRLLEPNLESIHFLTSTRLSRGILLGLRNGGQRVPISSYGDGMRRLLALRISLIGTEGGILLVDEIDRGLHWTVMEEMWKFVVKVASRLNVQVFATTHSYDCI